MSLEDGKVLDTVMLETLAVIAAANERSLVEELNRAVRTYVMNEIAEHNAFRSSQPIPFSRRRTSTTGSPSRVVGARAARYTEPSYR
jgi:hypothetical protein